MSPALAFPLTTAALGVYTVGSGDSWKEGAASLGASRGSCLSRGLSAGRGRGPKGPSRDPTAACKAAPTANVSRWRSTPAGFLTASSRGPEAGAWLLRTPKKPQKRVARQASVGAAGLWWRPKKLRPEEAEQRWGLPWPQTGGGR